MMAMPLALILLQSSRALLSAPAVATPRPRLASARRALWRATHHGGNKRRRRSRCTAVRASSNAGGDASQKDTALLWLSLNRLRVRDNLALARAAELGRDGLAICLAWPHNTSAASSIDDFTPVEAFGLAAARALDASLGELDQRLLFLPINNEEDDDLGPIPIIADAVHRLQPAHVVVDTCLLDRHRNYATNLRGKLQTMSEDAANATPNVVEVIDDGTLVSFEQAPRALGRSRKGGRAFRWTTFLGNVMKRMEEDGMSERMTTWDMPDLPPPLHGCDDMLATIPDIGCHPSCAQQLLTDWGEVSEEEAIRRVCGSASTSGTNDASPLTEKGSKDTKLSPYLRYGVISPQRAAKAGVRVRDLLWRDWSHICYGLTGPLRRGEAVLEFLDGARCPLSHELNVSDEDLFHLWCVGNTGSKVVDAGMRQLWKEGWMPRKMRILSAACLVEGLGIDWRRGRDWFAQTLMDHDPAINELMWQNAGFCGVDVVFEALRRARASNRNRREGNVAEREAPKERRLQGGEDRGQ